MIASKSESSNNNFGENLRSNYDVINYDNGFRGRIYFVIVL